MQNNASATFSNLHIDDLEDQLIDHSSRINASEYQFLVLLREFDLRQGWKAWGCTDCAAWLNLRCGIVPGTARDKVRTARALLDLPLTSASFEKGELSYSNVRAMTRVANPTNEQDLLDFAIGATASQVEQRCRQMRNGDREASVLDANRLHQSRWLSRTRKADGSMSLTVELPAEQGELIMKAIEFAMAEEQIPGDESLFALQADALVAFAKSFLSGDKQGKSSSADNYQVMVHVDESALRDNGGNSDLPVESVRRLTCDGSIVPVIEDASGEPLNLGRKHRTVSPPLKRALLARDRGCVFPGCTQDRWIDAHHVKHWADGGETSPGNLISLCSSHHRMVHEEGFKVKKDFQGEWYFQRPDGRAIPQGPIYTNDEEPRDVSAETIPEDIGESGGSFVSAETLDPAGFASAW
jgi:hypothetical protein